MVTNVRVTTAEFKVPVDPLANEQKISPEDFFKVVCAGNVAEIKKILRDKHVDPTIDDNFAIRYASMNGHLEVVKVLLQDKRVKNTYK